MYIDIIEEVLTQAMKSRAIMTKFLEAASWCLKKDSEEIIGDTQESSKVGMLKCSIVHWYNVVICEHN